MTSGEWREWVRWEAGQRAARFEATGALETRSPGDIIEDVLPDKRHVEEIDEALYDPMAHWRTHEHGPYSAKDALPSYLQARAASG